MLCICYNVCICYNAAHLLYQKKLDFFKIGFHFLTRKLEKESDGLGTLLPICKLAILRDKENSVPFLLFCSQICYFFLKYYSVFTALLCKIEKKLEESASVFNTEECGKSANSFSPKFLVRWHRLMDVSPVAAT